MVIYRYINLS